MKAGRNDPCPCGSGKKFKKCHGLAGPKKFIATVIKSGNSGLLERMSSLTSAFSRMEVPVLSLKDRMGKSNEDPSIQKEINHAKFLQEHEVSQEIPEEKPPVLPM